MNSPGHRKNILSPSYTHIGVGYYEKSNSQYTYYWTQFFYAM
ncbi:MAG: CAP domain-containing protein, partial [Clostridiales bacterium]|nr:CAP domain-containing protein [Clostridiales bacterium]